MTPDTNSVRRFLKNLVQISPRQASHAPVSGFGDETAQKRRKWHAEKSEETPALRAADGALFQWPRQAGVAGMQGMQWNLEKPSRVGLCAGPFIFPRSPMANC